MKMIYFAWFVTSSSTPLLQVRPLYSSSFNPSNSNQLEFCFNPSILTPVLTLIPRCSIAHKVQLCNPNLNLNLNPNSDTNTLAWYCSASSAPSAIVLMRCSNSEICCRYSNSEICCSYSNSEIRCRVIEAPLARTIWKCHLSITCC